MYLSSTPTAELWPDTLKGALRAIAVAAVFWALAATLLYLLSPGLDTWPRLLVFHECVGLTMVACVLLLRRTRAFSRFRPMARWLLTGVIAIPTGFVVGHQIAFLLLGEPLRMVGYMSVSLIPSSSPCWWVAWGCTTTRRASSWRRKRPRARRRSAWRSTPSCACCGRSSSRTCCSTRWPTCARWCARTSIGPSR